VFVIDTPIIMDKENSFTASIRRCHFACTVCGSAFCGDHVFRENLPEPSYHCPHCWAKIIYCLVDRQSWIQN
jgi:DNA-directed RNA polymerase subunit RPC12/RpoP